MGMISSNLIPPGGHVPNRGLFPYFRFSCSKLIILGANEPIHVKFSTINHVSGAKWAIGPGVMHVVMSIIIVTNLYRPFL